MDKRIMHARNSHWRNDYEASSSKMDRSIVPVEEDRWKNGAVDSSSMMDRNIVPVGNPRWRNDSEGSVRQINSISIDIRCASEEVVPPKPHNFSIREFVAGIQERDPNKCTPFQCDDDANGPASNLPQLWQCSNFISDIVVENNAPEMQLLGMGDAPFSSNSQQERGDKHEVSDPNNTLTVYDPRCTEEHEDIRFSRDESGVHDNGGTASSWAIEANLSQVQEQRHSTSDEHPSIRVNPVNTSLRSSNAIRGVNEPPRRKPKLRLLADIMEEEKTATKSASSSGMQVKSTENREQSEVSYPVSAAKRLKAAVPEKPPTPIEMSDSESEGDASVPLDLNEAARTRQPSCFDNRTMQINMGEAGRQKDIASIQSKGKRPLFEPDHSPPAPPSQSRLEDLDLQVALALSLKSYTGMEENSGKKAAFREHIEIPDLNESIPAEERSSTLQRNMEASASCSRDAIREGKRKVRDSELQAVWCEDNVQTRGAVDDTPMEIVELMAKNQQERELERSSQRHASPGGSNNFGRGSSAVYTNQWPCPDKIPSSNARRTSVGRSNKAVVNEGASGLLHVKNGRLDIGSSEANQFRLFGSFPLSQQRNTMPLYPIAAPNCPIQPHVPIVESFSKHCFKEKVVGGSTSSDRMTVTDGHTFNEARTGSSSKTVSSLEAYSNDKIPAMQLLNSMHRELAPSSSFRMGQNSFLNSQLPSHNCHLQGNRNDPPFSQNTRAKEFTGLSIGFTENMTTYIRREVPPGQGSLRLVRLNEETSNAVAQPLRDDLALGPCILNQNPAYLNLSDASNVYTISWKDLIPRNRNASKEGSSSANADGQKRQRTWKDPSGK